MNKPPHNKNQHQLAASSYGNAQTHDTNPRELEARILLKSAKMMKDLQENWSSLTQENLEETLKYNRKIWALFYETAQEGESGDNKDAPNNDLRGNIINLAHFIFKRETEIMADTQRTPQKLDALISINRQIAAGLMGQTLSQ